MGEQDHQGQDNVNVVVGRQPMPTPAELGLSCAHCGTPADYILRLSMAATGAPPSFGFHFLCPTCGEMNCIVLATEKLAWGDPRVAQNLDDAGMAAIAKERERIKRRNSQEEP